MSDIEMKHSSRFGSLIGLVVSILVDSIIDLFEIQKRTIS